MPRTRRFGITTSARRFYRKSIYGSSDLLPDVLGDLLGQGLAAFLGEIPLLVGHDIYLEHERYQRTFKFHEDGFGWDIFFQTDDDVTVYVPLCDLDETSGGRLIVERHPAEGALHKHRNEAIVRFAEFCGNHSETDKNGLVTRQAVEASPDRELIADELWALVGQREALPTPGPADMNPVDAGRGEVLLFNNKRYHDIEPWKRDSHRTIYIVRCFPLYDIGLAPPATFLNDAPCNRYILDGSQGAIRNIDCSTERPPFVPIPG